MTEMLLILKDDSKVGFHTRICARDNLSITVFQEMFGVPFAAEHHKEVADIVASLLREGCVHFEDGWIELRTGLIDVVSFFEAKVTEAKAEEDFADQERYREMQERKKAEADYEVLCQALTRALGPAGAADVRAKLAYAMVGAGAPQ